MKRLLQMLVTGLLACSPLYAQGVDAAPFFNFDSDTVVLEYSLEHGLVSHLDKTPLLTLRGDGLVTVHRPYYRRDAGKYELYLSNAQLQELLTQCYRQGLFDMDAAALKAQVRQLARSEKRLQHLSENEISRFRLRLTQFQAPGEAVFDNIDFEVAYANLAYDAGRYPQLGSLGNLVGLEKTLRALAGHEDLVKVAEVTQ